MDGKRDNKKKILGRSAVFSPPRACGIMKGLAHKHLEDYSALAFDKYLNFNAILSPST